MIKIHDIISKEELYDLYIIKNLSIVELSKIFNVSYSSISRTLRYYDINKTRIQTAKVSKRTFNKKYGVDNPSQLENIKVKKCETYKKHYDTDYYFKTDIFKKQACRTKLEKYNNKNYNNRNLAKKTCLEKYGVDNPSRVPEIQEKRKNSFIERYSVDNPSQLDEIKVKKCETCFTNYGVYFPARIPGIMEIVVKKGLETKRRNGSFIGKGKIIINNKEVKCSKFEEQIYNKLILKFSNIVYQYTSDLYPFACDFYIPELDLYIEAQGYWGHGKYKNKILKAYDKNDLEHQEVLKIWKEKSITHPIFTYSIHTWTVSDPLKRKTAKDNNLNWIEFFTMDEFMSWFEKQ